MLFKLLLKKNLKNKRLTVLNIYLDRISHNLKYLKSRISDRSELIAVVKANAYGHGAIKISRFLEKNGVKSFAVASADEGKILRENGIKSTIIVFYPNFSDSNLIIKFSLEPAIYSKKMWEILSCELKKLKLAKFPIHLKFNTGLNRLGFKYEEVEWIKKRILVSNFQIKSVYSHLSSSEEVKINSFTDNQIKSFRKIRDSFKSEGSNIKYHILNSSGVFNYPDLCYDWVRAGISLYGYASNKEWDKHLVPVAELISSITQIHKVQKGESVGYNCDWIAKKNSLIATIPIGHADGIGRFLEIPILPFLLKIKKLKLLVISVWICLWLMYLAYSVQRGMKSYFLMTQDQLTFSLNQQDLFHMSYYLVLEVE
jgi:alanine racemase